MKKYEFGTGRRKSAIVQARVFKGSGKIFEAKDKQLTSFTISQVKEVFKLISKEKDFDTSLILKGGGVNSQGEAAKLAVARAISKYDKSYELAMKKEGFLTRDPREKERKKPGLKRARRAPQWKKR